LEDEGDKVTRDKLVVKGVSLPWADLLRWREWLTMRV
jgi:hypothetical protein